MRGEGLTCGKRNWIKLDIRRIDFELLERDRAPVRNLALGVLVSDLGFRV